MRKKFQVLLKSHTLSGQQAVMAFIFVLKCLGSPLVSFLKPPFQACIVSLATLLLSATATLFPGESQPKSTFQSLEPGDPLRSLTRFESCWRVS